MLAQPLSTAPRTATRQEKLLNALEAILEEVRAWQTGRLQIRVQLMADFQMSSPTEEEVRTTLQDYGVFAVALRRIADQLDEEVDETMNLYYDWLYD